MNVSVKVVTPTSLRERKKAETHQRIAAAAWDLFERQGYERTTLAQVAEAASVSPRTVFHYFPTKEALVHPTLDDELDQLAEAFARRPHDEPTFASLLAASEEIKADSDIDLSHQQRVVALLQETGRTGWTYVEETATRRIHQMVLDRYAGDPDAEVRAHLAASMAGTLVALSMERMLADPDADMGDELQRCLDILREMTR